MGKYSPTHYRHGNTSGTEEISLSFLFRPNHFLLTIYELRNSQNRRVYPYDQKTHILG